MCSIRNISNMYTRIRLLYFSVFISFFLYFVQMSSDGNQTTSTLSITLGRADSGRYLSCRAYNHILQSEPLEDGWRLDIQCKSVVVTFRMLHAMDIAHTCYAMLWVCVNVFAMWSYSRHELYVYIPVAWIEIFPSKLLVSNKKKICKNRTRSM